MVLRNGSDIPWSRSTTYVRGVELTRDEIDVFVRTDARLWFWTRDLFLARVH
jgi:hypothetical protein